MVLGDKMRYYYKIFWLSYELKLKPYYTEIKKIIYNILYSILSYIYIFTGIKFKIGNSKK